MSLEIVEWRGREILPHLEAIAQLRINVFKEFPYLYQGSLSYELNYLEVYLKSSKSLVIGVLDQGNLVGASTALPLNDESSEFRKPFIENNFELEKIYYFGESIVLPEYRGNKLGHDFFRRREEYAKNAIEDLELTCFCAVVRPENHKLRPKNYRPLDNFWKRMGYRRNENLKVEFKWQDIDKEIEDYKELKVWLKNIKR